MPRFRVLSDVIRDVSGELLSAQAPTLPTASTIALQSGQALPPLAPETPQTNVLRWGFSTWGIEPVIGVAFPEDQTTS